MGKVAKLVTITMTTRVIVDEDANDFGIIEIALPRLSKKLVDESLEHIDEIIDDMECPYDPQFDEEIYPQR